MNTLVLSAGAAGKAKIAAHAKGPNLSLPALPLSLPLRVQLRAENGGCWEATYGGAGVVRNDTVEFKGRAN